MIDLSDNPLNKINHTTIYHLAPHAVTKKKPTKSTHVPTACINCKKAHLACDLSRPCKRCTTLGKCDTCIDIKHKKRGRPKLTVSKKRQSAANTLTTTIPLLRTNNASASSPTITASTSNFASLLGMAAPGLASCSFDMTLKNNQKQQQSNNNASAGSTADELPQGGMMTIFLSMDLCCARVSDESMDFLNIHPSEIDQYSFYDLIHADSSETLSRIHRLLLDNVHSHQVPQQSPISFTSDWFLTSSPAQLFQIANGSLTFRETLKFNYSGKSMSCRFFLGGGFGADLLVPSTLDRLYMVCILSDLNSITSASNIAQDVTCSTIATTLQLQQPQTQLNNNLLVDSLLQEPFDSVINTTDLLRMYNVTAAASSASSSESTTLSASHSSTSSSSCSTGSTCSFSDNDAIQLARHLYEAMLAPSPTTPPTASFKDQYLNSVLDYADASLDCSSIPHHEFVTTSTTEIDLKSAIHSILNDDSLFMLNSFSNPVAVKTSISNDWGCNIDA